MRASEDASFTLIALMTGTRKPAQNSGGSAPWSCTAPRPHAAILSSIRPRSSSTKPPPFVPNGGSAAAISLACAAVTRRRLGAKISPMASAPASAATTAVAESLMPQILTLTIVVHAHRLSRKFDRLLGDHPRFLAASYDDLVDITGAIFGSPLADWFQKAVQRDREPALHLDVAHRALSISLLELFNFSFVGVERIMINEDRVAFDMAGIGGVDPRRIRIHCHDLARHGRRVVGQINGVVERLAHLRLAVGPGQGADLADQRVGFGEDRLELLVEPSGDLPRDLEMAGLILTHWDDLAADDEDVGSLQDGVGQQPQRWLLDVQVPHHVLERRHALQTGDGDQHGKDELKLSSLRHK